MVNVGAVSCAFGAVERDFDSIENLDDVLAAHRIPMSLDMMGCRTFRQSELPVDPLVNEAVAGSLAVASLAPESVTHVFLATSDNHLHQVDNDLAARVLTKAGLTHALPILVSMQKCASSIVALDLAAKLVADRAAATALVVGFDVIGNNDAERVKPFALFGDAAACCVVSSGHPLELQLASVGAEVDPEGLAHQDTMESRKVAVRKAMDIVTEASGVTLDQISACFSTNLFKPVAMFNASISGLKAGQLSLLTAATHAHCGNADWMINLAAHSRQVGLIPDAHYMAQSFAPGYAACALFRAVGTM